MTNISDKSNLISRPPVVVVLGHVDHGKTTLLDFIRQTSVAAREAGGITQATAAYEITHNDKKITFIDTPGHGAFTKMRSRGAKIADLAILVVAADDGVKPQTEESIKILQESKIPFIVAINKIDKNNADINRTKQDLANSGVLLEGFGGNISFQEISAKEGTGINELLDLLLLVSELENFTFNPNANASGFVIEAKLNKQRGNEVMVIVKNGELKSGQAIVSSNIPGKIKILENDLRQKIDSALPSAPVTIIGFESLPSVGASFEAGTVNLSVIELSKSQSLTNKTPASIIKDKAHILNLIIKSDTSGSAEALSEVIAALPIPAEDDCAINIISASVGDISDGDVKQAINTNSIIIGFNTKVSKPASNLAEAHKIKIITSKIIYEIITAVEESLNHLRSPEVINNTLEVLAVFSQSGSKQTVGGRVTEGLLKKGNTISIEREENSIGRAKIIDLQVNRVDAKQVEAGSECGLILDLNSGAPADKGDIIRVIN